MMRGVLVERSTSGKKSWKEWRLRMEAQARQSRNIFAHSPEDLTEQHFTHNKLVRLPHGQISNRENNEFE